MDIIYDSSFLDRFLTSSINKVSKEKFSASITICFWDKFCIFLRSPPSSLAFSWFASFHLLGSLLLHITCHQLCLSMLNFIYCIAAWFQRKPSSFFCSPTWYNQWMQLAYCFPSVPVIYIDQNQQRFNSWFCGEDSPQWGGLLYKPSDFTWFVYSFWSVHSPFAC